MEFSNCTKQYSSSFFDKAGFSIGANTCTCVHMFEMLYDYMDTLYTTAASDANLLQPVTTQETRRYFNMNFLHLK